MSGDVQPRKRKDKRRRKGQLEARRSEEYAEERINLRKFSESSQPSTPEDEELFGHLKNPTDEVIHVQKEAGLGGNICTKVIFFLLLGAIGVTVGIILVKYQGSTDEDVVYNDEAPWNVAIKQWIEYLPVVPEFLRGETDDHHNHSPAHSEEEHEEEEEEAHDTGGGGELEAGDSWLDIGQQWLSELEFDFSFGTSSPDVREGGEEEEGEKKVDEDDKSGEEEGDEDNDEEEGNSEKSEELREEKDEEEVKSEEQYLEGKSEEQGEDDDDEEEEEDNNRSVEQENEEDDEEESRNRDDTEEEKEQSEEQDDDNKEEEEDVSLEDLGRDLDDEYEEAEDEKKKQDEDEEDASLEDLGRELEEDVSEELEKELSKEEEEDSEDILFKPGSSYNEPDRGPQGEEGAEEEYEEESFAGEGNEEDTAATTTDDIEEHATADRSEEELFPEAIEALKLEASELLRAQAEAAVEKEAEQERKNDVEENEPNQPEDENGTDGTETSEPITEIKSKEEFTEAEVTSREVPGFEAIRVPAYTTAPPPPPSAQEEFVQKVYSVPASASTAEPTPKPQVVKSVEPEQVSEDEEEEEEEEEEEGEVAEIEGGDDEIDEDIGLSPKRYQELLEKYGQPTPESSDIEQSDDEPPEIREYSDGAEAESVGEEESANELEESEPEEVEEEEETYIKVEKPATAPAAEEVESEDEEEEEEEEEEVSEDEPPPPPPPTATKKPASTTTTPSRERGGPKDLEEDYPNAEITNADDWTIREELDMADEEFNFDRIQSAMDKFTVVLTRQPKSPRALYGVARALDLQAEAKSSNTILDKSIDAYMAVIRAPQVPDELFRRAAERLINRLRFRGQHMKAVPVHRELINRFNNSVQYRNDLAINYLMVNRLEEAGAVFRSVLERWPQDPMARSHYGLVLKLQGRMKESIPHLLAGISTDDLSTRDARLYFHVGDALARTGQKDQAMKIYVDGVAKGLFRSKYQRSLYNVDRLAARPWWTQSQTQYQDFFRKLEENWKQIKEEGMKALKMKGLYQDESESLRDSGDWKQFELYARGVKFTANCNQAPATCSLIDSFPPARTCKRGQTKFSVMSGGTHVWPHCGPTNCRLRAHLGLVVPKENIAIRVAEETRKWEEGKVLIFDDSFEHEVWHNGTAARLVLIVDVWHPDLTAQEIRTLSPI